MQIENSVFISYRRANAYVARSVYQELRTSKYDVFLDYQNIDSGSFERIILNQIGARAHFVLVLTPTTLERCVNPADWVRREIEHAMELKRNIVPLMFDDFDFEQAKPYLTGKLEALPGYNGVRVPQDYFEESMARLRERFLNKPLEVILHPVSIDSQAFVAARSADLAQDTEDDQTGITDVFERGKQLSEASDFHEAIAEFSEAITRSPGFSWAYYHRGLAHAALQDLKDAIADFSQAIENEPQNAIYYFQRASAFHTLDLLDEAIKDYGNAIRLNPADVDAYISRGDAYFAQDQLDQAHEDYEAALKIEPDNGMASRKERIVRKRTRKDGPFKMIRSAFSSDSDEMSAEDYYERAVMRHVTDIQSILSDLSSTLEAEPDHTRARFMRANRRYHNGDFPGSIDDYSHLIEKTPKEANLYVNRAENHLCAGEAQQALEDYVRAEELRYRTEFTIAGMALAYAALGHQQNACKLWRMLLKHGVGYHNADWVGNKLNWHPKLITMARELIEQCNATS